MRKALIVGVDYYEHFSALSGCVNDALAVSDVLKRNADGTTNFINPKLMLGSSATDHVKRAALKDAVRELFANDAEIALFYFAGHGYIEDTGGFLCTSDSASGDDGLSLAELTTLANQSKARTKMIILDSCHSGSVGNRPASNGLAELKDGMTLLTASTADQFAEEVPGGGAGVFTRLLVDALGGAAANLVGDVTPGSVYAHIDQSLGPWAQRPVFKTNVQSFVSLRKATPPIGLSDLQAIAVYFPTPGFKFSLDPSYEPERSTDEQNNPNIPPPDPTKVLVFGVLQKYVKVNLVRPLGAPHMWHAAMQSKACELTVLGEHYRRLAANHLI